MLSIEEEINKLLTEQDESSKVQIEKNKQLSLIRENIKNGKESTGDSIRDFILAYYLEQKGTEENIRSLEKDISNNQGKKILVVREEGILSPPERSLFGRMRFQAQQGHMNKHEEENLGILEGDLNLDIKKGNILIPTQNYVARGHTFHGILKNKEGLQKGPIDINFTELLSLNARIPDHKTSYDHSNTFNSLRILIGDELVELYYKLPGHLRFYGKHLWKLIEKKQKGEDVDGEIKNLTRGEEIDSFYYKALKLMDQKIPKEIQEKWDKEIYDKKLDIIKNLNSLITRESELVSRIEQLYGRIDKRPQLGGRVLYETEPTLVGPDEDTINIISMPIRNKLEETRRDIKKYLGNALEMKMYEESLILEGDKPGISIDIQKFISSLCKTYKIDIPN